MSSCTGQGFNVAGEKSAKSRFTHGLKVGICHFGSLVVESAHRWPGVGLVLEVLQMALSSAS